MNENLENKIDFKQSLISFYRKNKFKLIFFFIIVLLAIVGIFLMNVSKEKKNLLISEKYIKAGVYLSLNDNDQSLKIFREIIMSKNNFYSPLSLYTIIEKNLETNPNEILKYFDIIENLNIEEEQKELILLKKALYLINIDKKKEAISILQKLTKTQSNYKELANEILKFK